MLERCQLSLAPGASGASASLQQTAQPISSPLQAALGQPCSARPTDGARRLLLTAASFFTPAPSSKLELTLNQNTPPTTTISRHIAIRRANTRQDAEMQATPPPIPPTILTFSILVFCDYCDVYLTHDSMSVRKAHNSGRNHLRNVVDYYQRASPPFSNSLSSTTTTNPPPLFQKSATKKPNP